MTIPEWKRYSSQRCSGTQVEQAQFLLVSDGGAFPRYDFRNSGLPAMTEGLLLYRADQIAREQVSAIRTRWLMEQITTGKRQGLLVSLLSALDRIGGREFEEYCKCVPGRRHIPTSLLAKVRAIRPSLDRFTDLETSFAGLLNRTTSVCPSQSRQ